MNGPCQRCGDMGMDLRTLWMACFYDMSELRKVPFDEVQVKGTLANKIRREKKTISTLTLDVPVFEEHKPDSVRNLNFYTLRVCKECRADWMKAINTWFETKPKVDEGVDGYFIRDMGGTRLMTEEEINARTQEAFTTEDHEC